MNYSVKLFLLCFIVISVKAYSQKAVFVRNGDYKYFVGKTEPDTNWYKPGCDDSSWETGHNSIGFGYVYDKNKDSTKTEPTVSLYLRIKFFVGNKDTFKCASFFADYDDGFLAFLNGKEIIRTNMGKPGEHFPHDSITDRSHETVLNRFYYYPNGYYLDSNILKTIWFPDITSCLSK
jgi:hypothetical protein